MPHTKLHARNVSTVAAPDEGSWIHWDTEPSAPHGFGIRTTAEGARTYVVAYRVKGRERRVAIAGVEEKTLKAARDEAREYREAARKGRDLWAESERAKLRGDTVASLIEMYLEDPRVMALRTYSEYSRLLSTEVVPVLGTVKPDELRKADVRRMLDAIVVGKKRGKRRGRGGSRTRILRPSPSTAARVLGVLQAMYGWAVDNDRVERAPAWPSPPWPPPGDLGRTRWLVPDEIRAVWAAVEAEEVNGNTVGSALKLMLVLGQRRGETLSLRFQDVQQEATGWWWTIPPERTKNARPHRVPLTAMALEVIEHRRGRGEEVWVFPSDRPSARGHLVAPGHALARLRAACPNIPAFTIHDLRRTVASQMAEAGVPRGHVGHVLNHTAHVDGPRVTRVYDRYEYGKEKRVALETWERRLRSIISGADVADVVPITREPAVGRQ
jgi:integrase